MILNFGLPKGSLQESTLKLLAMAGYEFLVNGRNYFPQCNDSDIQGIFIRAQEIAKYVEHGVLDVGLTGKDWIIENDANVIEVCELLYAKSSFKPVRWVLAVPENSDIQSVKDLEGKKIATEAVNITKKYLNKFNVKACVEFSWGATEVKTPSLVDAIVELTETGNSLRANNLRIIDTVLESTTRLIANKQSYSEPEKRKKIDNIALLLQGAINAKGKAGLKFNIPKKKVESLKQSIPAMKQPTVSQLLDAEWVALEVIIDESVIKTIIPDLKKHGATDLIEYPLNKVIY